MKSVTVELLYVISSPIYKSPYVVLNLNTSFSFLPKADITLDPKPVYFSHFTPKVLQHFPYIISVLFIYSLDKPAEDIQLHKYLSILSHLCSVIFYIEIQLQAKLLLHLASSSFLFTEDKQGNMEGVPTYRSIRYFEQEVLMRIHNRGTQLILEVKDTFIKEVYKRSLYIHKQEVLMRIHNTGTWKVKDTFMKEVSRKLISEV